MQRSGFPRHPWKHTSETIFRVPKIWGFYEKWPKFSRSVTSLGHLVIDIWWKKHFLMNLVLRVEAKSILEGPVTMPSCEKLMIDPTDLPFLEISGKWNLVAFNWYDVFEIHPHCNMYPNFILRIADYYSTVWISIWISTFQLPIYQLMVVWITSTYWLLWITSMFMLPCEGMFLSVLGRYVGKELLGHRLNLCFPF